MKKKIVSLALATVSFLSLAACGGEVVEQFDENKTQIFVAYFNGGFGDAWAEDLKAQFNAANDKYEIVLRPKKQSADQIFSEIKMGTANSDIYFSAYTDFQEGFYGNLFEDLSDVLDMEPDGAGTGTVKSKMVDYESWQKVSSKYGMGCYMLPWDESIVGMVFDYKVFVENGWLNYAGDADKAALSAQGINYTESNGTLYFASASGKVNYAVGDVLLTAGKDGKYGTYDDGQPTTMAEFDDMLGSIAYGNKKAKTFLFSGLNDNYTSWIMQAVMAQYMGTDLYKSYFTYDSGDLEMPMHDGSSETITLENGYKVFHSEGAYQGLSFIDTYFNASEVDENVKKITSYSHTDAQNDYLLGYKKATGFPAMLVEGAWWENEAKAMFDQIAREDANRGFGKREYRYMMLPTMEGQAMAADKTAVETAENGAILVTKTNDSAKLAKIKEFITLFLKTENLKKFTKLSGGFTPYKYDLSESELNELSPFIRNAWEIYNDKDHVELLRTKLDKFTDPFIFTAEATIYTVPIKSGASYVVSPVRYLRDSSVDALFASDALGYKTSEWANFITLAQAQGFFNN